MYTLSAIKKKEFEKDEDLCIIFFTVSNTRAVIVHSNQTVFRQPTFGLMRCHKTLNCCSCSFYNFLLSLFLFAPLTARPSAPPESMAKSMSLLWGSGSTPCWRVMITLEEKKLQGYKHKLLSFEKGEHKSQEVLEINPRGQVGAVNPNPNEVL